MSSKVYPRGEIRPAEPILWPRVGPDPGAGGDSCTSDDPHVRLAQVEQEMGRRVQEARQAGFQEGLASGKAAAEAQVLALGQRVAETIAELAEIRPRLRRQAEGDLVKLSLAIARRILHRELVVDPEALRGLVQAALAKLRCQESCRVRVHPSQEAIVRSALDRHPLAAGVEIVSDPALDRGAVIFETARGNLDASVETQLCEIEQGLSDRLERHA